MLPLACHEKINALPELAGAERQHFSRLLFISDQNIILVFALLLGAVLERGHAVAVLLVVEPLALVLETIGPLGNAVAGALVLRNIL